MRNWIGYWLYCRSKSN